MWLTGAVAALALAASAESQDWQSLAVGMRVRVTVSTTGPSKVIGRIASISGEELRLSPTTQPGKSVTVSRSDPGSIEVSRGTRGHAGDKGALIGFLAGALFSLVAISDEVVGEAETSRGAVTLVYGLMGTAAGAGIGALARTERWAPVLLTPSAARGDLGLDLARVESGVAVRISLRF